MDGGDGFPPGNLRTTPLPDLFFSRFLPDMTDEAEIRVTLHVFWQCNRRRGRLKTVTRAELLSDATLRRSLSAETDWEAAVERGLDLAVRRGTLLRVRAGDDEAYLPNTATNRALVASGALPGAPLARRRRPLPPVAEAPGAATRLYERYIGLVTPMIAAELAEAEKTYPAAWLDDAFAEAATRGKRNWRYVEAILRRWAAEGKT